MKLIRSHEQCSIVATAMLLGIEPKEVIANVGHDGTEVKFPELPAPLCYRGVHIQEIIDFALIRGYALVPIEAMPAATTDNVNRYDVFGEHVAEYRLECALKKYDGLLCGQRACGVGHTVAWNRQEYRAYDPCGPTMWSLDCLTTIDFKISTFWAAIKTPERVISAISNHLQKII